MNDAKVSLTSLIASSAGGWRDIERGRVGIAVWRFDRIDKAVRRFNAGGADAAVLQRCVGIVASCDRSERAMQLVTPSCRSPQIATPFTSVRRASVGGDIIGRYYVAGGVGGDTVNGIGVVLKSPAYSQWGR